MSTMLCPFCKSDTEVLDTRKDKQGAVRRRRVCFENHHRFTTYENLYAMEPEEIQKVKRELRVLSAALQKLEKMFR